MEKKKTYSYVTLHNPLDHEVVIDTDNCTDFDWIAGAKPLLHGQKIGAGETRTFMLPRSMPSNAPFRLDRTAPFEPIEQSLST